MNWVQHFRDGTASDRALLGGKGANLAEMASLGLNVPPGFTITTDACRAFLANQGKVPAELWGEVNQAIAEVEATLGKRFGDPNAPLLVSVRSGAEVSMPGMMDTILNVGMSPEVVQGFGLKHGDRFALDCQRRLIQMVGKTVYGIEGHCFEREIAAAKEAAGAESESDLSVDDLLALVERFRTILAGNGTPFPDDPQAQLRSSIETVFRSWQSERAIAYRRAHRIPDHLGTAVTVQAMVFGNGSDRSATGVAFTRDPNTGEAGLFGEYLVNAQGEDVVAGIRTPMPVYEMGNDPLFAAASQQLHDTATQLETHFRDMQDIEFTIEEGRLWMLQARTGNRTARAAVRTAIDMVGEGLIRRSEAVQRLNPVRIEELMHPQIAPNLKVAPTASGLPASPGAASGAVTLDPAVARTQGEAGEAVILVREETSPDDFPGMQRSRGILTTRGGMTSHAAVVARGMGIPAVTGCTAMQIDFGSGTVTFGDTVLREGDHVTIDGTTGNVFIGDIPVIEPDLGREATTLLSWADQYRRLGVRANADTPADAAKARELGAAGIGLCRTEHMFFDPDRINLMRAMILADTDAERLRALDALEEFQFADFSDIFRTMDGLPVTIRTLDPPLHEFLPHTREEVGRLAKQLGTDRANVERRIDALRESNPMLGHRGCRLGITQPEITRMQARAIMRAAIACTAEGITVLPEIMIPLVATVEELRRQRAVVEDVIEEMQDRTGERIAVLVGTMIELPRAALIADEIAEHADFISFGTNDLTQTTFGLSRDDTGSFLPFYIEEGILPDDPFQSIDQAGVGKLVQIGVRLAREAKPSIKIGICGEHGGDPASVGFFHRTGLDYVSCSPFRVPVARLAAAHAYLTQPASEGLVDTVIDLGMMVPVPASDTPAETSGWD